MGSPRLIADRYSLVELLPGSATGNGWRAQDVWSGQLVAITRVPMSGLAGQELLRARHEIAGEVRVLGGLQHDRLARVMDVVLDTDDLWVASELLSGVTMADELARRGAVEPAEVARWGCDVAEGLAVAHGVGVAHRDLHAGVVGIAADGRAVVGGFATTVVTLEGLRSGIPVHVAPEVARGANPSPAADVFALGVMLYCAVEGRGLFPAAADREQLLAAVIAGVVAPPQRAGRLSGPLRWMLHPDPAQRPVAAAVADQLRQLTAAGVFGAEVFGAEVFGAEVFGAAVPGVGDSVTTRFASPEPGTTPVTPGAGDSEATRRWAGPSAGVPASPGSPSVVPPPYRGPMPWVAPTPGPDTLQPPGPGLPPTVTAPSAGRRKRIWWVVAAAVAVVLALALAGGLLVAFRPSWTSALTGLPASTPVTPPPPPSPIGDPRTADPCGLLNVGPVQRFGQATMYRDFGYPQSCVIEIRTGGESFVDLTATFGAAADRAPVGVPERFGELTISRDTAGARRCDRTVVLGDRSRVYVSANAYKGAATDLCAVADAGTQTAVSALSSGSLPRRTTSDPPNALTGLDTCSLLDQAALGQVPGLDATRKDPGFAGWLCTWGDNPAFLDAPEVWVTVSRVGPLSGQPVRIGGRSAQVTPGGYNDVPGTCLVELVQRSYTGTSGNPRVELLQVSVFLGAQQPKDAACRSARALAEAAAPKLPPA